LKFNKGYIKIKGVTNKECKTPVEDAIALVFNSILDILYTGLIFYDYKSKH